MRSIAATTFAVPPLVTESTPLLAVLELYLALTAPEAKLTLVRSMN